jgi:TetR/AcrR family transcriptional regulator, cholesterol catabolism regulator
MDLPEIDRPGRMMRDMGKETGKAVARKRAVKTANSAHDDKRLQIIERCAELFDSGGYHRATMQLLADEVGLGKPTLYHYFKSKSEILYAIHQMHIAALIDGLDSDQRRGSSPEDLLVHAAHDILDEIANHPGYVRAFFEHYGELDGAKRSDIRARRLEYFEKICGIIKAGITAGLFRKCDVELTAYGFLGIFSWAYQWYPSIADRTPTKKLAETLCATFLQGLRKPG